MTLLAGSVSALSGVAGAAVGVTGARLTLAPGDVEPDGEIIDATRSPDGRYVVFTSDATNLVPDDTNAKLDVFVKDTQTGAISRVSLLTDGTETDDDSFDASICQDGKIVAFTTDTDLFDEDNDTNLSSDVYLVRRDADNDGIYDEYSESGAVQVQRMSVAQDGTEPDFGAFWGSISGNCEWVAYVTGDPLVGSDANDIEDIYVRATNPAQNINRRLTAATADGGGGFLPALSYTGRYVAFPSYATDIVTAGGDKFGVYLRDRDADNDGAFDEAGAAVSDEYVSKAADGTVSSGGPDLTRRPSITPDGRCVAFKYYNGFELAPDAGSNAVYVRDRVANTTEVVSKATDGTVAIEANDAAVSPNCNYVTFDTSDNFFAGTDGNGARDVYLRDRGAGTTTRLSVKANGDASIGTHWSGEVYDDGKALLVTTAADIGGANGGSGFRDPFFVTVGSSVDSDPPTGVAVTGVPFKYTTNTATPTFTIGWTATDPNLASITVQRRTGGSDKPLGAWANWKSSAAPSNAPLTVLEGYTYCWKAKAADSFANESAFTPAKCVTRPLLASRFKYSTGSLAWVKKTSTKYYGGMLYTTNKKNAAATRKLTGNRIAIVATTCKTCGGVRVYWNGALVKSLSLTSPTTVYKKVIEVVSFGATIKTGTLKVVVATSGKPIYLEGAAALKQV
jgi:Tol biopolymer transport system component